MQTPIYSFITTTTALLILTTNSYAQTLTDTIEQAQITQMSESVSATVRCPGKGIAVGASYTASRADVKLEEESGVDCDTGGCYAWQMRFSSPTPEPFDVKILARCKGVDPDKSFDNPAYLESLAAEQGVTAE